MPEKIFCTACGFQLSQEMKFCPLCGEKKFSLISNTKEQSTQVLKPIKQEKPADLIDVPNKDLCNHTYVEAKGALFKDKDDTENRLFCGICQKEFPRAKVPIKKEGMKDWQKATLVGVLLVILFAALSQGSNSEVTSGAYPYKLGYDLGFSGDIGRMVFYGQAETAKEACSLIIDLSKAGTTTDGIPWASIDKSSFVKGCVAGYQDSK